MRKLKFQGIRQLCPNTVQAAFCDISEEKGLFSIRVKLQQIYKFRRNVFLPKMCSLVVCSGRYIIIEHCHGSHLRFEQTTYIGVTIGTPILELGTSICRTSSMHKYAITVLF